VDIIQLCAVIHEPVSSMDVKYEIFQAALFAESSKYRELAFMIGRAVENYNPIIASVEVFELFDILAETVDFSEVRLRCRFVSMRFLPFQHPDVLHVSRLFNCLARAGTLGHSGRWQREICDCLQFMCRFVCDCNRDK
jgi:hypothetical protein